MTKADSLNNSEISGVVATAKEGAIPIRKKGYHRALKQGKSWALYKQCMLQVDESMKRVMGAMAADLFLESPFLSMLRKESVPE